MAPSNSDPSIRARRRVPWMLLLKALIVVLVVVFIIKAVDESRERISASGFSIRSMDFRWLGLAAVFYLVGILPMALNWHRLLRAMGGQCPRSTTVRTYYVSQLGKYVPGKAIVVAIRMGVLGRFGIRPSVLFVSVVAETMTMMSVGSVLAACIMLVLYWGRTEIALTAAGLAVLATIPILPPMLRLGLAILQMRKFGRAKAVETATSDSPNLKETLNWRAIIPGWIGVFPGWLCLGMSVWSTMKAMNVAQTVSMTLGDLPWVLASYAISVVAGFLSMLPGGVGVRELVMKEMIEPTYGPVVALLAPVFHRLVILTSELLLFGVLFLIPDQQQDSQLVESAKADEP